jgi:hypothetical protein
MMIIVGLTAWRAGSGLADAANSLGEGDRIRLAVAGLAQAVSFTTVCLVTVPFATLGTSSAPFVGVGVAAVLLFAGTGGVAFVRSCALARPVPAALPGVLRAAAAGVAVYLAMGAVLVAGSVIVHAGRVETLSRQVGGGWSSVAILLLDVLAAPNAVIAGAAYLAGPGFAVGAGSANAVTTAHGLLPAFPLLGAMPEGHGASGLVWWLIALTSPAAGLVIARQAAQAGGWRARAGFAGAAAAGAGALMALLAWQGGGSIGDGRLRSVGASPGWVGLFVTTEVGAVAALALSTVLLWHRLRAGNASGGRAPAGKARPLVVMTAEEAGDAGGKTHRARKLAG